MKKHKMNISKYRHIAYWFIGSVVLFMLLQHYFAYQFFYAEQQQLFELTTIYLKESIFRIGGATGYLAGFLVQFYALPYWGAMITTMLIVSAARLTDHLIRHIPSVQHLTIFSLFPAMILLLYHLDSYYTIQGTLSFIAALAALRLYLVPQQYKYRLIIGLMIIPVLFYTAGSVSLFFALSATSWELLANKKQPLSICTLPVWAVGLSLWSVFAGRVPDFRIALLPDFYYYFSLRPHMTIYLSWGIFLLLVFLAFKFQPQKPLKFYSKIIFIALQLFLLAGSAAWGVQKICDFKSLIVKELNYFAEQERWDEIIKRKNKVKDFVSQNLLNLALAEKGVLLERLLTIPQYGPRGLLVEWNRSELISTLYSDVHYCTGNICMAQRYAFEAHMSTLYGGNPRMIKRLIKTNLIFGEHKIAEKYISQLEKTLFYRKWAAAQRIFLNNDSLIEQDQELGTKRKFLLQENRLSSNGFNVTELKVRIDSNPSNKAAFDYAAALCLLKKNPEEIRSLIDKYYGTPALKVLPVILQEAVTITEEQDVDYWKTKSISAETINRFIIFKKAVIQNKQNKSLAAQLAPGYKNSYWFYYMFD